MGRMGRGWAPVILLVGLALLAAACRASEGDDFSIGRLSPPASSPPTLPRPMVPATGLGAVVTGSGIVMPVVSSLEGGGWTARTPCNLLTTVAAATPVTQAMVVLDPGHGGSDPGAISPGGLAEAGVNLEVARYTQAALEAAGVSVLLTRTADYDIELPPRAELARALQPLAFVSVHHNAEPDGPRAGPGSETYYQIGSPASKRLSGLIYEEVVKALSAYSVPWVADTDAGAKYRPGTRGDDYYAMLRLPGNVVSVLAELAFISNPAEAELLAQPEFHRVEGEAVARGILRYLTTKDPGSGFTEPYPRIDPPRNPNAPPTPACREPQL